MTRPLVREHNVATNEIIEREMNDEEYSQHLIDFAKFKAQQEEEINKISAKNALLDKLGITEEEAKLLLG